MREYPLVRYSRIQLKVSKSEVGQTKTDVKRSHKLRKTFASNLNAGGVPLDVIRECLGHSDLKTTMAYLYNPLSNKSTYDMISRSL